MAAEKGALVRINIYAEELTNEVEVVTKTVTDDEFGERTFYGLRFYLKSPPELHHSADDDDRSAVTMWVKWTRKGGSDLSTIRSILTGLTTRLDEMEQRVEV